MNGFPVSRIGNTKDESTLVGCIGQPSGKMCGQYCFPPIKFVNLVYITHSGMCLTRFPNTMKFVKNTPLCMVFLGVWKCGQTQSFVFDISYQGPISCAQPL